MDNVASNFYLQVMEHVCSNITRKQCWTTGHHWSKGSVRIQTVGLQVEANTWRRYTSRYTSAISEAVWQKCPLYD